MDEKGSLWKFRVFLTGAKVASVVGSVSKQELLGHSHGQGL